MRTKRKRACRKAVPDRKSAALASNETTVNPVEKPVNQSEEAFLSFVNQNRKEDCVSADSNDLEEVDAGLDKAKNDFSLLSSSSDGDESISAEESSSNESSVKRRSRRSSKGLGNGKEKASQLPKKGRNDDVQWSRPRVLRSSNKKQDACKRPQDDPRYDAKELKAALEVIKKIMKMDEAQPFNVPVDPIASGKPEYFNVIDTPMDFGTIYSNLENGIKYMNSEDVFKDVQYIWENCCKSNKKGEYIVYLMKRVKKKFMKYWIAAGLSIEQSRKINVGTPYEPSTTDYATRHSRHMPSYPVGSVADGASQMQQGQLGFNQQYPYFPPSCSYSQPHQVPQPPPSTVWPQFLQVPPLSYHQPHQSQHPQPNTYQQQFSQLQDPTGFSHFQPPAAVDPKHKNHASKKHKKNSTTCPASSIHGGPPGQSQQPHLNSKQPYGLQQSPLSHGESSEQQQRQPKASHFQPQSTQLKENEFIEHSQMSPTDSALRGIKCALRYSPGPTTNKSNQENQEQLGRAKSLPEQTPQSLEQQQLTKKKRVRGPTRCLFLNDLEDGERIFVQFNNSGQPVGRYAIKLSYFLGTIARNGHRAPLNFIHWRAMPESYKEDMWEYVQEKFDIDPSGKPWVMQAIATKWRVWKGDLKKMYYDSLNTDEERLKVSDPRVVPDQWPSLISYWNSDDTKERCAKNRANRLKQRFVHSTGTKSYARICEEERNKRPDGKEPTRAELYILTHTRKNGEPVDETAAKLISKIREQEAKKQTTSQCSDESNDTLCQVMGEENDSHVGAHGIHPNRTGIFGSKRGRDDLVRISSETKSAANEEVRKMAMKMEAMEEKYALMENHIAKMSSNMEKFLEKIGGSSNILGSE